MARYSAGTTPTGVGNTVRPCFAVLSTAAVTPITREVAVVNTTITPCQFEVVRFSGGTAGPDVTEFRHRENAPGSTCQAKGLWSADATIGERTGYIFELGAAIGSGAVEVFGAEGLEGLIGATAGIGLVLIAGAPATAPRCRITWDE